jgi:hypothetical protein
MVQYGHKQVINTKSKFTLGVEAVAVVAVDLLLLLLVVVVEQLMDI